jgi:hypothetical protein
MRLIRLADMAFIAGRVNQARSGHHLACGILASFLFITAEVSNDMFLIFRTCSIPSQAARPTSIFRIFFEEGFTRQMALIL